MAASWVFLDKKGFFAINVTKRLTSWLPSDERWVTGILLHTWDYTSHHQRNLLEVSIIFMHPERYIKSLRNIQWPEYNDYFNHIIFYLMCQLTGVVKWSKQHNPTWKVKHHLLIMWITMAQWAVLYT